MITSFPWELSTVAQPCQYKLVSKYCLLQFSLLIIQLLQRYLSGSSANLKKWSHFMRNFLNTQQSLIAHELTEKSKFLYFPLSWDNNQWLEVQVFTWNVSYILFINFIVRMPSLHLKKKKSPHQSLFYNNQTEKTALWSIYEIVPA